MTQLHPGVVLVVCVLIDALPWPALAALGALPLLARALKALRRPQPERPPHGFPVWPLWFAAFAFTHTRRAGALLVAGLAVAATGADSKAASGRRPRRVHGSASR